MTNKEIEKFIRKNIIGYIGTDLIQKGTYILFNPFDDILGGFCFEGSASDKSSVYIWWFVQPLFIPDSMIHLTFGNRLENLNHSQSWENLYSTETTEEIREVVQKTIPLIVSLIEPGSFYDYFKKKNKESLRIYEALIYVLIWKEAPNWKKDVHDFINVIDDQFDTSINWIKKIREDMINISSSSNPRNVLEERKRNLITILDI